MQYDRCPLCDTALEVREVAPCAHCGGYPDEIEHLKAGKHTYDLMRIFDGLTLVLCNFCQVDFGSMDPEYFGLPRGGRVGYEYMQHVQRVENPGIWPDKWCPACYHRLAFLKFAVAARALHEARRNHPADERSIG